MSPQQLGQLGCFNGITPKRHSKDDRKYHLRNEDGQSFHSTPRSCHSTPSSKGRSRRLFVNRPSSVELFPSDSSRYSCSEPICFSTGSSPVNKTTSFICSSAPCFGSAGVPEQLSMKLLSTPQNMKKKKYGPRQQQNQCSESLKALEDRFASSRYSDSPKAKQVPLPPVDWIDEGSSRSRLSERLSVSSASERGSPVFFDTSFSSRSTEDFYNLGRSQEFVFEDAKVCRANPIHMNALQLIEAVSAS